jgi:hypothetical protein
MEYGEPGSEMERGEKYERMKLNLHADSSRLFFPSHRGQPRDD